MNIKMNMNIRTKKNRSLSQMMRRSAFSFVLAILATTSLSEHLRADAATAAVDAKTNTLIKRCQFTTERFDTGLPVHMDVQIFKQKDTAALFALTTATTINEDGSSNVSTSKNDQITLNYEPIRQDVTTEDAIEHSDDRELNMSEQIISHAKSVTQDPILNTKFDAGLDLNQIQYLQSYIIGQTTGIGIFTVVEAFDANKQSLGSFIGGFIVRPCE